MQGVKKHLKDIHKKVKTGAKVAGATLLTIILILAGKINRYKLLTF